MNQEESLAEKELTSLAEEEVKIKRGVSPGRFMFSLAITGIFLYLFLRHVDTAEVGATLSRLSYPYVAMALVFLGAGYFLRVVRWWVMLGVTEKRPSLKNCASPFLMSIAINNLFPMRAGDIYRLFSFPASRGISPGAVLATLFLERLLDLLTLLALFFIAMPVGGGIFPESFIITVRWLTGAGGLLLAALILSPRYTATLLKWIEGIPFMRRFSALEKALEQIEELFLTIGRLCSLSRLLLLLGLSFATWCFEGGVFWCAIKAINHHAPLIAPYFSLATATLSTLLPSSPGYVGTFDYFAMLSIGAYGMEASAAGSFALVVHLMLWVPTTLAGLTLFLISGGRLRRPSLSGEKL